MRPDKRYLLALPVAVLLAASALAGAVRLARGDTSRAEMAREPEPATVEKIHGTDLAKITLTKAAAARLGVQTSSIGARPGHPGEEVIPYGAVLYDPDGRTFAYTSPAPLVYVRRPIEVQSIAGDRAYLRSGPPPGTTVVTVGALKVPCDQVGRTVVALQSPLESGFS